MSITVVCHKCGTLATVPDSAAGMQGKCEHCGNIIYVPGGVIKQCCVCHADVSHAERTKDAAGNYYCASCAKTRQHAPEATAKIEPGTTGESAVCVICKAKIPRTRLCNFNGELICSDCARKEALGTTPYLIKKTRLGGTRITYRCTQCLCELESALHEVGKEDYCPQCGAAFDVPGRYEKFKATRLATVLGTEGTAAALTLGDSSAISQTTATGKGKFLTITISAVAAVIILALMVSYAVMKPNAVPTQIKPANSQSHVVKAAGAKTTAGQTNTTNTRPAVSGTGGKVKAAATPIPPKLNPTNSTPPPTKAAAPSLATDIGNQLRAKAAAARAAATKAVAAAAGVVVPWVAGANTMAASLPGFRMLSTDVKQSVVESGRIDSGGHSYVTISGVQAAATFPRWKAELTTRYPHKFIQPEWRIMVKGRKPIIKMLTNLPLTGGGLAGFDHHNKLRTNVPMVKFYHHRGAVAGLVFIDSTELYNSLRTNSMQRARMVFRAYVAKYISAVADCTSAMGVPYCGVVIDYGINRLGASDAVTHPRALVVIASCSIVNQFSRGHATIQLLLRKSDCFQENGTGGLFKIRMHY